MATCPYCEKVEKDLEGFKPWVENHNNAVLENQGGRLWKFTKLHPVKENFYFTFQNCPVCGRKL